MSGWRIGNAGRYLFGACVVPAAGEEVLLRC